MIVPYNRINAVRYASRWALARNPAFYDFSNIGGDCTNFASQCLYAGSRVMDYTETYGWYYIDVNNRAPAWTGVEFLYNYLVREENRPGPIGIDADITAIREGDILQLSFDGEQYSHTPVVLTTQPQILVAAHSEDSYMRPLSSYNYVDIRYIHIIGVQR